MSPRSGGPRAQHQVKRCAQDWYKWVVSGPVIARAENATDRANLARAERMLMTCLILLKLHVLYLAWGNAQGFDAAPWLEVFANTHWFAPLPDPQAFFGSYHPPLSYLVCRWIYAIYPHEVEASQILSTFAAIGTVFAFRETLRTIGILWTLPGLALLYVSASFPLVVWLAIETSYDALLFMWFAVSLALSVHLFWMAPPDRWWRHVRYLTGVILLASTLAAGLFTKFSGALAFELPVLIILARRRLKGLFREFLAPLAAVVLAAAMVAPLYYTRYYLPLGHVFPQAMEWLRADDLSLARATRNLHPSAFLFHILRIPGQSVTSVTEPIRDSFIHSIWFQMLKRDSGLVGSPQSPLSLAVSNLYARIVPVFVTVSTLLLCFQRHRLPSIWRQLGFIFFVVLVTYCGALLYFGWSYPLWDWEVFKAKYVTPAILWIAYCVALPFVSRSTASIRAPRWRQAWEDASLLGLLVLISVNHLLPVY